MSVDVGKFAKVVLGSTTVAEIGQYAVSGQTVDVIETTAFGDEAKDFIPGMIDPGEITFSGNYDPTDTNGQIALETACAAGTEYGPGEVKIYVASNTYLTPKTGGVAIVTRCKAISVEKSGVAKVEFSMKLSGKGLEQLND